MGEEDDEDIFQEDDKGWKSWRVENTVKRAVRHSPKSDAVGRSIGYR